MRLTNFEDTGNEVLPNFECKSAFRLVPDWKFIKIDEDKHTIGRDIPLPLNLLLRLTNFEKSEEMGVKILMQRVLLMLVQDRWKFV
jgi:hypothetical protein